MIKKLKKVLIIGSGAIRIGQAGEFDYSGSQCIKALKEEGIKTVLVNPNIATIQTSEYLADKIYFLPTDAYFVERVIEKERPDGILLGFGGQSGLNTGVELADMDVFEKYGVEVLGTPVDAIKNTEDRALFVKKLGEIELKVPRSFAVNSVEGAVTAANKIGYPVMCRIAYALGGLGSGVAYDERQLLNIVKKAFTVTKQILVEEYLGGWKEIEYEVVRDAYDNCITVCSMENFDPMGIHTGESIVAAPVQTLTASENFKLRALSIRLIRHLGIVGECNIQFALDPESEDYRIIEVNARLSRSSALASKATGYPLAFIATKLALGYALTEVQNTITKDTSACFEPSVDYIVLKVPRWDLQKFREVHRVIGSEMKSVGEVMAIGRSFEEVLQKAIRMLGIGVNGLVCNNIKFDDTEEEIKHPTDRRIFAIAEAIKNGCSVDRIYELSKIDKWFLYRMKNIIEIENELKKYNINNIPESLLRKAKKNGFADAQLAHCLNSDEMTVREKRKQLKIIPVVKQIDTLAGEFPAKTNYLYLTYNGTEDDLDFKEKDQVIVLGSGAYRIGSSVEFDWCCVNAVLTVKKYNYPTIMINCNPETVSTDYDICDKLYFEELTFERVLDIYEKEKPHGIIISMGGQIPNNLAMPLYNYGARILGTSPESIDNAEDRYKFSKLLDSLGIDQPGWKELTSIEEAKKFSENIGYPVLVRPSYVLSGSAMSIAFNDRDLELYLSRAVEVNRERPVVISKFITNAKEIEIDAVAKDGKLAVWAISEHVENAGVHSGDATMVYPPQNLYIETIKRIKVITEKIASSLNITGPFNIQFIAKENDIKVIECNLRASRSFPLVSKVSKINFIDKATRAIIGEDIELKGSTLDIPYVGVKAPQFSFSRLKGADPVLTVEMTSTGEVACLGDDLNEAFLKSIISTGFDLPKESVMLSIGGDENKYSFLKSIRKLREMGFDIFATKGTSEFLNKNGVKNIPVSKVHEPGGVDAIDLLSEKKLALVINIPAEYRKEELDDEYAIRRSAIDFSIPLITNLQLAELFVDALSKKRLEDLKIKSWDEY